MLFVFEKAFTKKLVQCVSNLLDSGEFYQMGVAS